MTELIQRELQLPAPPDDVWRAITDPAWLCGWLADEVQLELRPGGEAYFRLGREVRSGWVEEVSAPSPGEAPEPGVGRLAFWWASGDEPASRVEIAVTGISEHETRVKVVETRPLEILDLVGMPLSGNGGLRFGPALVAA